MFKVNHDHTYSVRSSKKKCTSEELLERFIAMRSQLDRAKEADQRSKMRERQRRYRAKQKQKCRHVVKQFNFNEEKVQPELVKFVKFPSHNGQQTRQCRYEHIMDEVGVLHTPTSSSWYYIFPVKLIIIQFLQNFSLIFLIYIATFLYFL